MGTRLRILAVATAAGLALTACGGSPAAPASGAVTGEVSLQTWSLSAKFQGYLDKVIAGFEAKYPGTKVTLLDQPGEGYATKVISQASTNTLPDVINIPPDFGAPLARVGALLDVSTVDPALESTYVKGALDAYRYRDVQGVYAFPWYLNTDISYWNKAQLLEVGLDPAHPPATVDEQFAAAKIMHDRSGGRRFLLSSKPTASDFARAGIPILSADGTKATFNTPAGAALVQRYADAYRAGYFPAEVLNDNYLGNSKLFTSGQVAFSTGGGPAYAGFVKDNPSLAGNIVMSPALNDSPPLYVQGLAVSAQSKNQATAVALAQWVLSPENQLEFGNLTNTFPSTIASTTDPSLSKSDGTPAGDAKALAFGSLQKARILAPVEYDDAMQTIFVQQVSLAMKGDVAPQAALDTAAAQIDKLLANR